MERKKNYLSPIQTQLLMRLTFAERFDSLVDELEEKPAVVADELRGLIDKNWVQVMVWNEEKSDYLRSLYYDTDHMDEHQFMATTHGLDALMPKGTRKPRPKK